MNYFQSETMFLNIFKIYKYMMVLKIDSSVALYFATFFFTLLWLGSKLTTEDKAVVGG